MMDILAENEEFAPLIHDYQSVLKKIDQKITGADLKRFGIEGSVIGQILKVIREAWLLGKVNNPLEEREYIEEYFREKGLVVNLD